ncbi:LuxR C-terminal-related transcriptional regulator, partial [Streptacidiphilus monticola]
AAGLAAEAAAGSATDGDLLFRIRALGVLGDAELLTGTAAGAAQAVEALQQARELSASMELADPDQVRRLADLAEAELQLGDLGAAAAGLREAQAACADWPAEWGRSARAALDRARALLLAAESGPADRVTALLSGAAESLRELGLPLDLARTLLARGAVERRNRHRTAARTLLAEAELLARERGALPLLARVQAEQRRLDPGERTGEAVELTPSESRVARLAASGATNREVAAILFVSVKTVEGTLSRVYRKLGVRSRTALARWAETLDQAADGGGHESFTRTARVNPLMGRAATS